MGLSIVYQVINIVMILSHLNYLSLKKLVRKIFSINCFRLFVSTGLKENISCCGIVAIFE